MEINYNEILNLSEIFEKEENKNIKSTILNLAFEANK